jgi:hypothetical protein
LQNYDFERYSLYPCKANYLSGVGLALKISHTQNILLRIESTGRYVHHKQVDVEYYYTFIYKFILRRRIIFLMHTSVLRRIWLDFMVHVLCSWAPLRFHNLFGFPHVFTWASLKRFDYPKCASDASKLVSY